MKRLLYLLVFIVMCAKGMEEKEIREMGMWSICSPLYTRHKEEFEYTNPIEQLYSIGHEAYGVYNSCAHITDAMLQIDSLFNNVDEPFLNAVVKQIHYNKKSFEHVIKSIRSNSSFHKIILAHGWEDSWKISLCCWGNLKNEMVVHNHKRDCFSKIIVGNVLQNIYIKDKDISSILCSQEKITEGESYCMLHDTIHEIIPEPGSITLVFSSSKINNNKESCLPKRTDSYYSYYSKDVQGMFLEGWNEHLVEKTA